MRLRQRTMRLVSIVGALDLTAGLLLYLHPDLTGWGAWASLEPGLPLLTIVLAAAVIPLVWMVSFAYPTPLRRILTTIPALPAGYLSFRLALALALPEALLFGTLAVMLAVEAWLPWTDDSASHDGPGRRQVDLTQLAMGTFQGSIAALLVVAPGLFGGSPYGWLLEHRVLAAVVAMIGGATLWTAAFGYPLLRSQWPVDLVGSVFPLVLAGSALKAHVLPGVLAWLMTALVPLVTSRAAMRLTGRSYARMPGGPPKPGSPEFIVCAIEVGAWHTALVLMLLTELAGPGVINSPLLVRSVPVAIVVFAGLFDWILPDPGSLTTRAFAYLGFVTLALGLLLAQEPTLSHPFLPLLVITPLVTAQVLGPASGRWMLGLVVALLISGDYGRWWHPGFSWVQFLVETLVEVILLAVTAMLGFRSVARQREMTGQLQMQSDALQTQRDRLEDALESRDRMAAILEATTDVVGMAAPGGRLLYLNKAGRRMLGIGDDDDLASLNATHVFASASLEMIKAVAFPTVIRDGVWSGNVALWRPDGSDMPVSLVLLAHRNPSGEVTHFSIIGRDISEQLQAEKALRESELKFRRAFGDAPIGVSLSDIDGRIFQVNRAFCEMLGYTEAELVGAHFEVISHPEDVAANAALRNSTLSGSTDSFQMEKRYFHKRGDLIWCSLNGSLVRDAAGSPQYFITTIRDITENRRAQEALRQSEELFRSAFDHAAIGMALLAPTGQYLQVNRSLCEMLGFTEEELLARRFQDLTFPDDLEDSLRNLERLVTGQLSAASVEKRYLHKNGHVVWVLLNTSTVHDASGAPLYLIAQIQDITERKRVEEQLVRAANYDPLTGLFNRRFFTEAMERELAETRRYGTTGALLFLDLDHFKEINDSMGHPAGDDLLADVAVLLQQQVREADLLGRLGGDEFAVLLTHTDADQVLPCARRILEAIRKHVIPAGEGPYSRVTTSIGIALYPNHGCTTAELLAHADVALYQVKAGGRDGYALYSPERSA